MSKDIFGNPLEFGKMWNLHCQVGNDVVKLKETQKTLSDVVDECIRQCNQANQCLIKGREIVKVTAIENEKLKAKIERLERAGDAMLSEWASGDEKDAKNFLKALIIWETAKGVQS